ncbi:MAG TPA: metallophosphoesterase [Candidatus Eisenbacteria bacterium]|jgi:predicted MPP superfamily phosphohydrolase|nr:metallophosphoesterase [Candidatus Eisenbacteria bacterium]
MIETLVFDSLIAFVVGAVPVYFAVAVRRQREGKGTGPGILGAVGALVWIVVVYGSFIEPRMLEVRRYDLNIGDGGRTLTVALISDTHLGQYRHEEWLRTVVDRVDALAPDVVLIAGDVVSNAVGIGELGPLRGLKSRYGSYAVLGNWDYQAGAVDARKAIEAQGVEVLTNESVPIAADGGGVRLAGLDDVRYGKPDIDAALAEVPPGTPTILLVHNPDAAPLAESRGINLVLAGHTHAGQVRLPLVGPVPKMPIRIGQQFDKGLFYFGPTRLFITPGVGESGTRARLFNPPEISFLRITY